MRQYLRHYTLILIASFLLSTFIHSQDRFAFAITDNNQNTASWTVLRKLDLKTGAYGDALLNGMNPKLVAYDATSRKQINGDNLSAFSTGVAAIAYDKRNNRIYYTPMFIDQLRYIDLKTMKVYYVADQSFIGRKIVPNDDSKVISRMVIAPDGYGYAITNDATTFVRFSTNKKLIIEQLGSLVDDPGNTGISIHNRCSSWGGDMVADDAGNLYLLSAGNSVFRIDIDTKVATWIGTVNGLPPGFTINGIAVTDEGSLLAGSQGYTKGWYVIDPRAWSALPYAAPNGVYLTSDLANGNILFANGKSRVDIALMERPDALLSNTVQLYPNPISVNENQFKLQFNKLESGDYTIELTDVTGKRIMTQKVNIVNEAQIQTINLKKNTAQGIYLVKVTDINSKSVFTQKLVVQ